MKMKKLKIKESFQNKKFKHGGYATLLTAVVLGLLILVNLLVDQVPLKADLTKNRLFSLSDQTYQVVDRLEQEVTIYGVAETGRENRLVDEILQKYSNRSKKVTLEYVDPYRNPGFFRQFTDGSDISEGSYIVACGNKYRVINSYDLFNYSYENPFQPQVTSLAVEERVTGAVIYVTAEKTPVIYNLTGHGEESLPREIREKLQRENYDLEDLALVTAGEVPENTGILLVVSPKRDFTADEEEKIREYLAGGGRALFILDLYTAELDNIQSLLRSYGATLQPLVVVEGDGNRHAGNQVWLLPQMENHEILAPLRQDQIPVLIPAAQSLEILDVKRRTLELTPLLLSSERSWGKTDLPARTLEKEAGDVDGPLTIAMTIVDNPGSGEEETRIVLVANSDFLSRQFVNAIPGNTDFLFNSLNWLQDRQEAISIRPKSLLTMRLRMTGFQSLLFSGIAVLLIPLGVLGTGLFVWLRRRHR